MEVRADGLRLARRNLKCSAAKVMKRAEYVSDVTESLIEVTNKIADHTQNQISEVHSLVEKMDTYSALAEEVLATSQGSTSLSEKALETTTQGNLTVQEFTGAMAEIRAAVDRAKEVVGLLNSRTVDIDEMLKVIRDIAEATSILSLNASIQSAHAGQAGRGFSVVAQEVKRLAERSGQSAEDMQQSVNLVADNIRSTVGALDDILERVREGENRALNTSQFFTSILHSVGETTRAFQEIASAVVQQTSSLEGVSRSITTMSHSFERLYSLVEVASAYSSYTRNTLGALTSLSSDLSRGSTGLFTAVEVTEEPASVCVNLPYEPATYDPHLNFDYYGAQLLSNVHMGLLSADAEDQIIPGLASRWYYREDTLTWTFHIRKEARFWNGKEVTAADVKFSLERLADPRVNSPSNWALACVDGLLDFAGGRATEIRGIKVLDKHRLSITLSQPFSGILTNLSHYFSAVISCEDFKQGHIIGCGPYRIVERSQERCRLEACPEHIKGEPHVKYVDYVFSNEKLAERLASGALNVVVYESADVHKDVSRLPGVLASARSVLGYSYLGYNLRSSHPLVQCPEARRAVSMALNRQSLVDNALGGMSTGAYCPLPPAVFGKSIATNEDPSESRRILAKFAAERPLTILMRSDDKAPIFEALGRFCVEGLQNLGLKFVILRVPHSAYLDPVNIAKSDLFLSRWVADTPEADSLLAPVFYSNVPTNRCSYSNEQFDRLIDAARVTLNPLKRQELYRQAQELICQDMPVVFLNYITMGLAYHKSLRNVNLSPMGILRCEDMVKCSSQGGER